MTSPIRSFLILVHIAILLSFSILSGQAAHVGELADDFTLVHQGTGEEIKLSDFVGEIVVLDFVAPWCGPCYQSTPWLKREIKTYYEQLGGNPSGIPVRLIPVNIEKQNTSQIPEFNAAIGEEHIHNDPNDNAYDQFRLGAIPLVAVINMTVTPDVEPFTVLYRDLITIDATVLSRMRASIDAIALDNFPANDSFTEARDLGSDLPVINAFGKTEGYSAEAGEPNHAGASGNVASYSAWWSWTAPHSGRFALGLSMGKVARFDHVLSVYHGDALNNLTELASANVMGSERSEWVSFEATAGQTVYIAVDGNSTDGAASEQGFFKLHLIAQENDDYVNAIDLGSDYGVTSLSSGVATTSEADEPAHFHPFVPNDGSAWWRWTAPEPGYVLVETRHRAARARTSLYIYQGNGEISDLEPVALQEVHGGRVFLAEPSQTYWIAVDSVETAAGGLLELELTRATANDHFANATRLEGDYGGAFFAPSVFGTAEAGEPEPIGGQPAQSSLWWVWTPSPGFAASVTVRSPGHSRVYTGDTLDSLSLVGAGVGIATAGFFAVGGETYWIAVEPQNMNPFYMSLAIDDPGPSNDHFANASSINLDSTNPVSGGGDWGATREPAEPVHGGDPLAMSVWTKWSATRSGTFVIGSEGNDTFVYTGTSVENLVAVPLTSLTPKLNSFEARLGVTYYVATTSPLGEQNFVLDLTFAELPSSQNDAFANPTELGSALPITVRGHNIGFSNEAGEPNQDRPSAWWRWTAPHNGQFNVRFNAPLGQTELLIYRDRDDTRAFSELRHMNVGVSHLAFGAHEGDHFYFSVVSYSEFAGPYQMSINAGQPLLTFESTEIEAVSNFPEVSIPVNRIGGAWIYDDAKVTVAITGGTAVAGVDYVADDFPKVLEFPRFNSDSQSVIIPLLPQEIADVPKTVTLVLRDPENGALHESQATLTIHSGGVLVTNSSGSGSGSLAQAMINASLTQGPDTISFDSSLTSSGDAVIVLSDFYSGAEEGQFGPSAFQVNSNISIVGPSGDHGIRIERAINALPFRLFHVMNEGNLTLENLTLKNGFAHGGNGRGGGGGAAGLGGAIFNQGILSLKQTLLQNHGAHGGSGSVGQSGGGGGVAGDGGNWIGGAPSKSTNALFGGGGSGYLDLGLGLSYQATPAAFGGGGGGKGNGFGSAFSGSKGGFGGGGGGSEPGGFGAAPGLSLFGGGGLGAGGAIFNEGGIITMMNSTMAGNTATAGLDGDTQRRASGLGGALFNRNGEVHATNCTIANNTVLGGQADGGGFYNLGDGMSDSDISVKGAVGNGQAAILNLQNCLVADSHGSTHDLINITINSGSATASGEINLIETMSGFDTGNLTRNSDPQLGPLSDHGGPTHTCLPAAGSPAVDFGDDDAFSGSTHDQRGEGFPRINGLKIDVGAVETQKMTFAMWQQLHFSGSQPSGPSADPDGDGVPNLHEYAFHMNPWESDQISDEWFEIDPSTMTIKYAADTSREDITYTLETCNDLSDWEAVTMPSQKTIGIYQIMETPLPDLEHFFARIAISQN